MKVDKCIELTQEEKEILGKASDILNDLLGEDHNIFDIKAVIMGELRTILNSKEIENAIGVLETLR